MSKVFEFDDGSAHNAGSMYDTRPGRRGDAWTRSDFIHAVSTYKRAKGPLATAQILETVCGHTDPSRVTSYAFGMIIGLMTQGLTTRPEVQYAADYKRMLTYKPKDDA